MSCEEGASRLDADVTKVDKLAAVLAAYKADMALLRSEMTSGFAQLNSRLEGLEDKIAAKTQLAFKGFENKALVYGGPIVMASVLLGVNTTTFVSWLIKTISHH